MITYDLSGSWRVVLDESKKMQHPESGGIVIDLPGTTSAAGIGPENHARETGHLTDAHRFEGRAWFSRSFVAEENWHGLQKMLTLERTRMTSVYIDGERICSQDHLAVPHHYLLPEMKPGEHSLTVCVDNTGYPTRGGHLTSPDTQSNWNGITGEISLKVGETLVKNIRIRPAPDLRSIHVTAEVIGGQNRTAELTVKGCQPVTLPVIRNGIDGDYPLPIGMARWDDLTPNLHTLCLTIGKDWFETTFGLRHFHTEGRKLMCNDREIFLRGKHDGLIFPKTGYAPTDVESWRSILQTAREYGINHYRFHTCCPPDAAFTAADELGIYFEPELPFWGTIPEEDETEAQAGEHAYLIREGYSMLKAYGHHPSFVMLSMGNELWGSKRVLNRMLADYRAFDPDKLYISGSNNFQFMPDVLAEEDVFVGVRFGRDRLIRGSYAMCDAPQGIVQVTEPESVRNYDHAIAPDRIGDHQTFGKVLIQYGTGVKEVDVQAADELVPQTPVLSHEVGQYEVYPDFSEIDRYTGPLKARNMEIFRERLQQAGLWNDHELFFQTAGKLAAACYRREIETLLRTRELAGFQLLDLQDFSGQGTALVGVLNAFMESKGLISAEEWRRFCSDTVVLGEFDRFVLKSGDEVRFGIQVSASDPAKQFDKVTCALVLNGQMLHEATAVPGPRQGRLTERITASLGPVYTDKMSRYTVRLSLADGTMNEYPVWVVPDYEISITPEGIFAGDRCVRFVSGIAEAKASSAPAIVIPSAEGKLKAEYCSDFWCYPMFRSISESMKKPLPTGTLGLCIDDSHPALSFFSTEKYTTPAWYHILAHAHCECLNAGIHPIVQMIDNVERCQRLGILYQEQDVVHLTARLWEDADFPEVKAFAWSLLQWLCSPESE